MSYPGADLKLMENVKTLEALSHQIGTNMWGDNHKSRRDIEALPGTGMRVENIVWNTWYSTSDPTTTNKDQFALAKEEYTGIRSSLDELKKAITALEATLDTQNIPYTPSRAGWKVE